jgi:hypothetical protein
MSTLPEYQGYAIPACDILADQLAECELLDDDAGDPADWPAWTDRDTWDVGPGDSTEEALRDLRYSLWCLDDSEPIRIADLEADLDVIGAALNRDDQPYEPTEEDLASYREWCEELDARWWAMAIERGPSEADVAEAHEIGRHIDQLDAMC